MSEKQEGSADAFDLEAGVPAIADSLRPKPKMVDRISKRVAIVAFAFVALMLVLLFSGLNGMDTKKLPPPPKKVAIAEAEKETGQKVPVELREGTGANVASATDGNASASAATSATPGTPSPTDAAKAASALPSNLPKAAKATAPAAPAVTQVPPATGVPALSTSIPKENATPPTPPPTPEEIAANQAKADRFARIAQGRSAGISTKPFEADAMARPGAATGPGGTPSTADIMQAAALAAGSAPGAAAAAPESEQDEKLNFVKTASKEERSYHPNIALPALSQNEVKTGSFIPMALEQGINSDLPGQITARVTEAVYDTITGCRLLIPPMSKVVGRYDSKIALGQGRMLVVWNSLVFPDGAELNLAGMQGYDSSGQAGLESEVDNHYLRLFGLTFGLSMITAAVQLSTPQPNPGTGGAAPVQTPGQLVAASLSQQFGQLGAQIIAKYIAVQPTLRNFSGERFNVMVPHTIVFPKVWKNRCASAARG